jgi:hypothetical protein
MSVNQIFDNSYWDILDLSRYLKVKVKTLNIFNKEILAYVTLFTSNKGELKNA